MSMTLAEALEQVHLEPGRTYLEQVDGHTVEVRVIADPAADEAVPDGPPYLQLAITFPPSARAEVVTARRGDPFPMNPIIIDENDLAPGWE